MEDLWPSARVSISFLVTSHSGLSALLNEMVELSSIQLPAAAPSLSGRLLRLSELLNSWCSTLLRHQEGPDAPPSSGTRILLVLHSPGDFARPEPSPDGHIQTCTAVARTHQVDLLSSYERCCCVARRGHGAQRLPVVLGCFVNSHQRLRGGVEAHPAHGVHLSICRHTRAEREVKPVQPVLDPPHIKAGVKG